MRPPRGSWDGVVHVKYLALGHSGTSKQVVSYLDIKRIHLMPLFRLTYNFDRWFPSCVTFNWTNRCGYLIYVKTQLDLKDRCSLVCHHKQSSTSVPPAGPETQARHTWVDGKGLNQTYLTLGQILHSTKSQTSQLSQWRRSQQLPWSLPISTWSGTGYLALLLVRGGKTQNWWNGANLLLISSVFTLM